MVLYQFVTVFCSVPGYLKASLGMSSTAVTFEIRLSLSCPLFLSMCSDCFYCTQFSLKVGNYLTVREVSCYFGPPERFELSSTLSVLLAPHPP